MHHFTQIFFEIFLEKGFRRSFGLNKKIQKTFILVFRGNGPLMQPKIPQIVHCLAKIWTLIHVRMIVLYREKFVMFEKLWLQVTEQCNKFFHVILKGGPSQQKAIFGLDFPEFY